MEYKKKPVIINADPYKFGMEDGFKKYNEYINADGQQFPEECRSKEYPRYHRCYDNIIKEALTDTNTDWKPYIDTLEGMMIANNTDMIITGVKGERYPCKLDIFNMTYELVE